MDTNSTESRDRYYTISMQQPMTQNDYHILYIRDGTQQQRFYRLVQFKCEMRRIRKHRQDDSNIGERIICKKNILINNQHVALWYSIKRHDVFRAKCTRGRQIGYLHVIVLFSGKFKSPGKNLSFSRVFSQERTQYRKKMVFEWFFISFYSKICF